MDLITFNQKVGELIGSVKDQLRAECVRLFLSGAIDVESYQDNFVLPKIMISVSLRNIADDFSPSRFSAKYSSDMENLKHF